MVSIAAKRSRWVGPSISWAAIVAALIIMVVAVIGYGLTLSADPVASHLAAANVQKITLERGACFGSCPGYTLTLTADGTLTYRGEAHTQRRGLYRAHMGRRDFLRLADALYRQGLKALPVKPKL